MQNGQVTSADPKRLPKRWPKSVTPAEALGYLLARHVPVHRLPAGPTLVREAAGWLPPVGLHARDLGMHQATVRSWMYAAQHHAAILGPPRGMRKLLKVLNDGVIRSPGRARSLLVAAGAGEIADPRTLADFARWCGLDPGYELLQPRSRDPLPAGVVVPVRSELVRARKVVDVQARQFGVTTVDHALAALAEEGIRIDAGNDAEVLRELLGTGGYSAWLWPARDVPTPLYSAMVRIRALGRPIPLTRIPASVVRIPPKRWPRVPGEWPVPVEAIRAWVSARDDWRLTGDDAVEPAGPASPFHRHDELIHAALAGGAVLHWTELHETLTAGGMPGPGAGGAIYNSPIVRRLKQGYALLDHPG